MMMALLLALTVGLAQAAPSNTFPHLQRPPAVSLKISPVEASIPLGHDVTLEVVVTNVSSVPQYLSADTPDTLQYDVHDSTGKTLVGYQDPPPPPPLPPIAYKELIWLQPGKSFVFYQHMPLRALGISKPGPYRVSAAVSSSIYTNEQWVSKYQCIFIAFAPRITLRVVSGKTK
jgi:hypothetical protein